MHSLDPPPFLKRGWINFDCPPEGEGESEKLKKVGTMVHLLKRGAGTFPIKIFQGLSFLHLEITLPFAKLCQLFKEKKIFCHHNFMTKSYSKLSKNDPENIL